MKISPRILLVAALLTAMSFPSLADIPSPARDACSNKAAGDRCDPSNGTVVVPERAHQCVPSTCRSPGANGSEYVCLICAAAPAAQQRQFVRATVAAPVPAEPPKSPRLWVALALGLIVLGVGAATIARTLRKRHS